MLVFLGVGGWVGCGGKKVGVLGMGVVGRRAVVLGGGLAGTLAVAALEGVVDEVTVVERDRLPEGAEDRRGVPQARHAHLLMSGGAKAIESLVPGVGAELKEAGAHRHELPGHLVSMSAQGWLTRFEGQQYLVSCSRNLMDWVVRRRVLASPKVAVLENSDVDGLVGGKGKVTGVKVRDRTTGESRELGADLVVDATGRGSRIQHWLGELGIPAAKEEVVDSGLSYATRIYRAPEGVAGDCPVINVQADVREKKPGQTATIVPLEGGRWLVTLSGTRGGEPPADAEGFVRFAREAVRHPIVGELIDKAEPLTDVVTAHGLVNRRRYFEKSRQWPAGLVVLGDAVATYNPVYGHGMSVAALSACAIRDEVAKNGLGPRTAHRIQRAVAREVEPAWTMASGEDCLYPNVTGVPPTRLTLWTRRYVDRLTRTAISRPEVAAALIDAMTLSAPMTSRLLAPKIVLATLRGPSGLPAAEPPFTDRERSALSIDS
ncbi:NAD(P)/FAD-dependent oxidoreductase [Kutzneria sp. 744]|uniref:FAD-dependent oxidoreductase n=1 Tax=Kutzneria sp. (strain 744) TaxID=345341 RepID=UPI0018DE5C87|nr:FAD-binding protein [Kutzneria sp. 744]